ncbi:hypothetical protein [Stenomitos frigidus]
MQTPYRDMAMPIECHHPPATESIGDVVFRVESPMALMLATHLLLRFL